MQKCLKLDNSTCNLKRFVMALNFIQLIVCFLSPHQGLTEIIYTITNDCRSYI